MKANSNKSGLTSTPIRSTKHDASATPEPQSHASSTSDYVNTLHDVQNALSALGDSSSAQSIKTMTLLAESGAVKTPSESNKEYRFRENFQRGTVELQIDKIVVFSSSEYRTTAMHAQNKYGLSDSKLSDMYRDYKEDYDNPSFG